MTLTLAKLKRRGLKLLQILLFAEIPMGLMSWRYLLPIQDQRLKLHRRFWWHSAWGALGLVLQLWLYGRWLVFSGGYRCFRVVQRLAPEVTQREGMTFFNQLVITLKLCLGYCIHPRDVYRFRLYRHPERALDYVYDRETQSFHTWQNQLLDGGHPQKALQCIQDKTALETLLTGLNIPVVHTTRCITARQNQSLQSVMDGLHQNRLFCKTRSGNRGLGAFAVRQTETGLTGRTFQGQDLENTATVEAAWQALLQCDDALVQPLLANHPMLAPLAFGDEVITVRYISQLRSGVIQALSATLEVPAGREAKTQRIQYVILPIAAESGFLQACPSELQSLKTAELLARVQACLPDNAQVPYWQDLVDYTHLAHQQFPEIASIAWDWVITPTGPVLLEGNSGWGTATPQLLAGGFLARFNPAFFPHTAKD